MPWYSYLEDYGRLWITVCCLTHWGTKTLGLSDSTMTSGRLGNEIDTEHFIVFLAHTEIEDQKI